MMPIAAQGEGVARTGGRLADGKDAAHGVELVGHGHDAARELVGQRVTGKARPVVLGDRQGDRGVLARRLGVVTAHDALLACELDHGPRHEVRLGQARRTHRMGRSLLPDVGGKGTGDRPDAVGLVKHRAELLLEPDVGQTLHVGLEGELEVLLVEELGIVETGADHALVAVGDYLAAGRVAVGHQQKMVRQVSVGVIEWEVALVGKHRLADDLVRDVEELEVEVGLDDRGPLHEVHDLVVGLLGGVGAQVLGGLHGRDPLADDLGATGAGDHHVGVLENAHIVGGARDLVVARVHETVAARRTAGRELAELDGNHLVVEQAEQPAHGAREPAGRGAPALGAQAGQLVVDLAGGRGEDLPHDLLGRPGGRRDVDPDVLLPVLLAHHEPRGVDALAAGKALGRLGGVALGVEGGCGLGAAEVLLHRLGRRREVVDEGGDAARRPHALDRAEGEVRGLQTLLHQALHALDRLVERSRGELFSTNLKDQLCHG